MTNHIAQCSTPGCESIYWTYAKGRLDGRGVCTSCANAQDTLSVATNAIRKLFPGSVCDAFGLTLYTREEYDARHDKGTTRGSGSARRQAPGHTQPTHHGTNGNRSEAT